MSEAKPNTDGIIPFNQSSGRLEIQRYWNASGIDFRGQITLIRKFFDGGTKKTDVGIMTFSPDDIDRLPGSDIIRRDPVSGVETIITRFYRRDYELIDHHISLPKGRVSVIYDSDSGVYAFKSTYLHQGPLGAGTIICSFRSASPWPANLYRVEIFVSQESRQPVFIRFLDDTVNPLPPSEDLGSGQVAIYYHQSEYLRVLSILLSPNALVTDVNVGSIEYRADTI